MKIFKTLLFVFGVTAMFAACSGHHDKVENPQGSWKSAAPLTVTKDVADATSATKTMAFDFNSDGLVVYSADYDVTASIPSDDGSATTVSYKVAASINGTWSQEAGEHDDYLLSFDTNTLKVQGTDAPELGPVTDNFISSLAAFTAIEDVEVTKDGTHMTFETKHPEVKYQFVKNN